MSRSDAGTEGEPVERRITSGSYSLRLDELYDLMWALADPTDDGTRVYASDGQHALKWLVAQLSGTPAERGRTMPDNDAIRRQVHEALVEEGWADRLSERRFRLLRLPSESRDSASLEDSVVEDPDDAGVSVDDVPVDEISADSGRVRLGGAEWSEWCPLDEAARTAARSPGVYLGRVQGVVVYVGMAGARRGQGVRGRLSVYARGRGAVSGLGEAAMDRALADPQWVAERLKLLEETGPARAKDWAAAALRREPIDISWATTVDAPAAAELERQVLVELADRDLWNRARPRTGPGRRHGASITP